MDITMDLAEQATVFFPINMEALLVSASAEDIPLLLLRPQSINGPTHQNTEAERLVAAFDQAFGRP